MAKRKRTEDVAPKTAPETTKPDAENQNVRPATSSQADQSSGTAFSIPLEGKAPIACEGHSSNKDVAQSPALIFTHGAGGGLNAPAMQDFAAGFTSPSSDSGVDSSIGDLVMFKGNMNLKSRTTQFRAVLEHVIREQSNGGEEVASPALGGRSMGARAACLAATALASEDGGRPPKALVLASYPLTGGAPSKSTSSNSSDDVRTQTLLSIPATTDVLFISGTEDTMCDLADLLAVVQRMEAKVWVVEVQGADHGLALHQGKGSKEGTEAVRRWVGGVAREWLAERDERRRVRVMRWDAEGKGVVGGEWREAEMEPEDEAEAKGEDVVEVDGVGDDEGAKDDEGVAHEAGDDARKGDERVSSPPQQVGRGARKRKKT